MEYDVLNACDDSQRLQVLPFYIRQVLELVFYRHSTTARIRKMAGFHLEVLSRQPYRDVRIYNGENLLMYARTIAPDLTQNALKGIYSFQKKIPIGDFLFHCPDVKRGEVSLNLTRHAPKWLQRYDQDARFFWIRQTFWYYQNVYQIELMEIFL